MFWAIIMIVGLIWVGINFGLWTAIGLCVFGMIVLLILGAALEASAEDARKRRDHSFDEIRKLRWPDK